MKKNALAGAVLLGIVLGTPACFYVTDSVRQDARQAATIPQAIGDGVERDVLIYQPVVPPPDSERTAAEHEETERK
jgi:hypothetical protein